MFFFHFDQFLAALIFLLLSFYHVCLPALTPLQYEIIHNPETVDLLVSLTYSAAAEGVVDEPLPIGMALRVPPPDKARIVATPTAGPYYGHQPLPTPVLPPHNYQTGTDGLVDFDTLPIEHVRHCVVPPCLFVMLKAGCRCARALRGSLTRCRRCVFSFLTCAVLSS